MEKWHFNKTIEGCWSGSALDTKAEAIQEGKKYYFDGGICDNFYVGKAVDMPVPSPVDASTLIERTAEMLDEQGGSEWDAGDLFFNSVTEEQTEDLHQRIEKVWNEWVVKNNIETNSYSIHEVEEIIKGGTGRE